MHARPTLRSPFLSLTFLTAILSACGGGGSTTDAHCVPDRYSDTGLNGNADAHQHADHHSEPPVRRGQTKNLAAFKYSR